MNIENRIRYISGHKVMIDSDLSTIYGVTTKRLNEQVRRNRKRFPKDFMFRLTQNEFRSLRSQIATLETGRGKYRKFLPYAFTEHGAVMLASILNSETAVKASIVVVRAFVKLRELLATHKELASKLERLESISNKHDKETRTLFLAIRQLMSTPKPTIPTPAPMKRVGYRRKNEEN